ncbi:MAG: formate dehydrogenase subunit delta [Lysobacterales bacterium]|jgi:formate dehydrogenase subunit delta
MDEITRLTAMANQIADNFSFHDDAVERIADHIQRFWAPSMRRRIMEFNASGGDGLRPEVKEAVRRLTVPG